MSLRLKVDYTYWQFLLQWYLELYGSSQNIPLDWCTEAKTFLFSIDAIPRTSTFLWAYPNCWTFQLKSSLVAKSLTKYPTCGLGWNGSSSRFTASCCYLASFCSALRLLTWPDDLTSSNLGKKTHMVMVCYSILYRYLKTAALSFEQKNGEGADFSSTVRVPKLEKLDSAHITVVLLYNTAQEPMRYVWAPHMDCLHVCRFYRTPCELDKHRNISGLASDMWEHVSPEAYKSPW